MDKALFPALLLAAEKYHQRWEIENTIDELKTHLLGRKTPIRSLKPREVVQEIYPKGYTSLWLALESLCYSLFNVPSFPASQYFSFTLGFYGFSQSYSSSYS
jgi:hypothetical protein